MSTEPLRLLATKVRAVLDDAPHNDA